MVEKNKRSSSSAMEMAERVAAAVEITHVSLAETRVKKKMVGGKYPPEISFGRRTLTSKADGGNVVALVSFVFDAIDPEDSSGSNVHIDATYELIYTVENLESFTDDAVSAFGSINACYNAWPFWREYVYSTLARMGLSPLVLPVFRYEDADSEEEPESPKPRKQKPTRKKTKGNMN